MAHIVEDVTTKVEKIEIDSKSENTLEAKATQVEEGKEEGEKETKKEEVKEEEVPNEVEPKTGVSFPVKMDGKQLNCVGVRKKSMLGLGLKIYGFGIYADNEKLKDILKSKISKTPGKPTKEMYQMAIDSDVGMTVRVVMVFSGLSLSMVKKNIDEGLGASIKKLTGGKKDDELAKKLLGEVSDDIKLPPGSIIEISRLPGYVLQSKVKGEVMRNVQSELLCRAYINMYLGDDAFDKDARDKFGATMLSLMQ